MWWYALGSVACPLAFSSACGGQVERETGSGYASGGSPSAAGGAGSKPGFPKSPLGECEPGFSHAQNPTLPCPWLGNGLCYEKKDQACACVCPAEHDSWCVSDFPDPEGAPTHVFCE